MFQNFEYSTLDRVYFGNTVMSYLTIAIVFVGAILFRRLIARWMSVLTYKFLDRFSADLSVEHFKEMLVPPNQKFVSYVLAYFAVHQLHYPLNLKIFKFKATSLTYGDLIDRILIFFIVWTFFKILFKVVDFVAEVFEYKASLTESKDDDQLVPFIKELIKVLMYIVEFFVILGSVFNVNVATLIAGLGVGGVALALAAKESLENLIGSFTIFLDKPFVVGDMIRVDNIEGVVEKVGFRSTRIRTVDNSTLTLPNKKLVDDVLDNLTLRQFRRVKFNLGLVYDTPAEVIDKISVEIKEMLDKHPKTNTEAVVNFDGFGDFSLNLQVIYFVEMMDYPSYSVVKSQINFAILEIVRKSKSDFAYPTYTIAK